MDRSFDCWLCGFRRDFPAVLRRYGPPHDIPVVEWPCWCWACGDVTPAEYVPSPAEILAEARAWKALDRTFRYVLCCPPIFGDDAARVPDMLAHLDAVFAWRRRRRSPGKCLECGSAMVSRVKSRYGRFEHPGCGGWIDARFVLFGGIRRMRRVTYSPEGYERSEDRVTV